jgi:phage-related protein
VDGEPVADFLRDACGDNWTVLILNAAVEAELNSLPADMRARFVAHLLEAHGLERVAMPYVRHLQDKLWEMRMKGRDGISRALYVTATGRRVIVVRVFAKRILPAKKTEKTPVKEIQLAMERAKEIRP